MREVRATRRSVRPVLRSREEAEPAGRKTRMLTNEREEVEGIRRIGRSRRDAEAITGTTGEAGVSGATSREALLHRFPV